MATEGMPFPWRWYGGTISTDLGVIWGMSGEPRPPVLLSLKDAQLVAQGEDLELELGTGPKPVSYDHGQKSQGITHALTLPRFGQTREFLRRMGLSEGTAFRQQDSGS